MLPVYMFAQEEDETPTPIRRRSNRPKVKRKSPQTYTYEELAHVLAQSAKRTRRSSTRTPTPVRETEKTTNSRSGTNSPVETDAKLNINMQNQDSIEETNKRKGKLRRRPGRPPAHDTDLSIAIRKSLLDTGRARNKRGALNRSSGPPRPRSSNSATSSSSSSSRSSSPNVDVTNIDNAKQSKDAPTVDKPGKSDAKSPTALDSSEAYSQNNSYDTSPTNSPLEFPSAPQGNASETSSQTQSKLSNTNGHDFLTGLHDRCILDDKSGFLDLLYRFMRKRQTPIGRIPSLGFKKRKFYIV